MISTVIRQGMSTTYAKLNIFHVLQVLCKQKLLEQSDAFMHTSTNI